MTKRLEETFNMAPQEPEDDKVGKVVPTIEESNEIMERLTEELGETDKIDAALPSVRDLNEHDKDMDEIHAKAIKTFDELVQLGMNVEVHAGAKLLETANQMLKTAMEAKDSKVDRKLRMINLQLAKARLDHAIEKEENKNKGEGDEIESEGKVVLDRNELLKRIAKAQKNISDDK